MEKARVLFVEDDFLIRMTLAEALADEGFDVTESPSADDALTVLQGGARFALLLTDVQLPGTLNGLDLAEQARLMDPGLPVIYMTGRPDTMTRKLDEAHEAVIAKPYLPSEVCATARRMMRQDL